MALRTEMPTNRTTWIRLPVFCGYCPRIVLHAGYRAAQLLAAPVVMSVLLCACSPETVEPPDEPEQSDHAAVSYTLSLQRASLTGRDFESYKVLPVGVFVECGTVYRGRPETQFQSIEQPSREAIEESKRFAADIIEQYGETSPHSIDPRGSADSLADPGAYTLLITQGGTSTELRTSVDWVEQRRSTLATLVNRFTRLVRGLPLEPPCGNSEFYGIGRDRAFSKGP